MYYLVTEYELPILGSKKGRKLITIGNKTGFTDMYDYHPLALENKSIILPKDLFENFMKDGFETKKDAEKDKKLKKAIKDFIGFFYDGNFEVMSEAELLHKYKTLK